MNNIGRPKKKDSRKYRYNVRLNDKERKRLTFCSDYLNLDMSEVIRTGIKILYGMNHAREIDISLKEFEDYKSKFISTILTTHKNVIYVNEKTDIFDENHQYNYIVLYIEPDHLHLQRLLKLKINEIVVKEAYLLSKEISVEWFSSHISDIVDNCLKNNIHKTINVYPELYIKNE